MRGELTRLDLRLPRRMLAGTAVGAGAYLLHIIAVYPTFRHDSAMDAMIAANPSAAAAFGITGSITSPEGWLSANMCANFGPLLGLRLTIGYGSAAIAGHDREGLLGLLATLPVGRPRIVAGKALALLVGALVVPLVSCIVCLLGPRFNLQPRWGPLLGVTVALTLLVFDLGAVALLAGAITGSRSISLRVASATAAASYLISSLSPVINVVHTIRWVSPFFWAVGDGQRARGVTLEELAALTGLGAILLGATVLAFRRLDVN